MEIVFYKSQSFNVITTDQLLHFGEIEEFSFVFISRLCDAIKNMFRKGIPTLKDVLTIDFPFDMIDGYFYQDANGLIIIGWKYAGKGYTDKEEIISDYKEFYPALIRGLEFFFAEIEQDTKLSKYIIDNNLERHKNSRPIKLWTREMVDILKKYYKFINSSL